MGFELTIPASERAKTVHASDRAATVTCTSNQMPSKIKREVQSPLPKIDLQYSYDFLFLMFETPH
jgi:hypothetical protein